MPPGFPLYARTDSAKSKVKLMLKFYIIILMVSPRKYLHLTWVLRPIQKQLLTDWAVSC